MGLQQVVSRDFTRCKMPVTLLRDYGIKHVVLSAGSRNLNLVRLFEANRCFRIYSVIDERSAGFFYRQAPLVVITAGR